MNTFTHKIGSRLARIGFVRRAIEDRADLSAFKEPPNWKIFLGMFLIALSFAICWPVISALGGLAVYYKKPLILAVGGPIVYILSHVCYNVGMFLCGAKYSLIVFRWMTRVGVEKLLGGRPDVQLLSTAEPKEPTADQV